MSEKESAKPIAYRFKNNRGNGQFEYDYYDADEVSSAYRDNCIEITPLYTAPQSAELDALRSQVAVLREALLDCRNHIVLHDDEGLAQHSDMIEQADLILSGTEAAAKEYEREVRNRVLEEAARAADIDVGNLPREEWSESTELVKATVAIIRAMKETP